MPTTPSAYSSPSATRAGTLISELNIVVPRAYRDFIDKFQFVPYVMMNELAGNTLASDNKLFYHYESKGRQMSFVRASATVAGAAGAAVTFTIAAGDYFASGSKSLPEVGMILYNARTGVESRVTAVNKTTANAHTVTILPVIATTSAAVTAADELQGRGYKYVGEASDYTNTTIQGIDKYTNFVTQIRIDSKFTDLTLAEAIDFEYDGQRYYKYKQLADDNKKFLLQRELMLMDSNLADNLGYSESGSAGVIQQTQANGLNIGYSTFDALTTFAAVERQLDNQGAPQEYDWLCDINQDIAIQTALGTQFNNGAIIYNQGQEAGLNGNIDLSFGFKSYTPFQRKFNFTRYTPFSEGAFYGSSATGTTRANFGLLIPKGSTADAVTRNVVPRFNIRFQDILGNGQKVQIAETGGLAKVPTSPKMELVVSQVAYYGVQVMGANQYAIVKGS
jgi:hypothetical protein